MSDEIQEYYSNEKNCYTDLGAARKAFGNTTTTEDQYDQMEKTLGIIYLNCPEDLQGIALATLEEASWRRPYFGF